MWEVRRIVIVVVVVVVVVGRAVFPTLLTNALEKQA